MTSVFRLEFICRLNFKKNVMMRIVLLLMIAISKLAYSQEQNSSNDIVYEELLYDLELDEEE
jgi:hypothetical protein